MIKSLKIKDLNCFKDEIKLEFHDKVNIIIGKLGKTTILESLFYHRQLKNNVIIEGDEETRMEYLSSFHIFKRKRYSYLNSRLNDDSIISTINSFLAHIDLKLIPSPKEIILLFKRDGYTITSNNLSDNEEQLVTLITTLSIYNETIKNLTVLIDKFELLLHPKYHGEIFQKLIKLFPDIQFFITTNSPFLLNHVSNEYSVFRIIKDKNNKIVINKPDDHYGKNIHSTIIESFDLWYQPEAVRKQLSHISKLIHYNRIDEAEKMFNKLEQEVTFRYDPDMMQIGLSIHLEKINKDKRFRKYPFNKNY